MKTKISKWMSLSIILTMLITTLIPSAALGAVAQINITSLYAISKANSVPIKPEEDSKVQRFTSGTISLSATIQNISEDQIKEIFYVVENSNTGIINTNTNNKAVHTPGSFDITFNNVALTDGLNKVTIKYGSSNVIASAPGWAYYTGTTSISNMSINNQPYDDTKIYPDNPAAGSTLTIKGDVTNATSVQAYVLGNPKPRNAFLNGGSFFFTADDNNKNNTTATFGLEPGDNQLTLVSQNTTKSFQTQRNLIYDNGKPFAYSTKIQAEDNSKLPVGPIKDLITVPTITTQHAQVSSKLKADVSGIGGSVKYRYVDVLVNGIISGTYDLNGASSATRVMSVTPDQLVQGFADTQLSLTGTGLEIGGYTLVLEDKTAQEVRMPDGVSSIFEPTLEGADLPQVMSKDKQTILYTLKADAGLTNSKSPYKLTVMDGQTVLNTFAITVGLPSPTTLFTQTEVTFPDFDTNPINEGYNDIIQSLTINGITTNFDSRAVTVDVLNLNGQGNPLATYTGLKDTSVDFNMLSGLKEGTYKMRVSYSSNKLAERFFKVGRPAPAAPTTKTPSTPLVWTNFKSAIPTLADSTATYFAVTGTNLATAPEDIVDGSIKLTANLTAGPQVTYNASSQNLSLSGNDATVTSIVYSIGASASNASDVLSAGSPYKGQLKIGTTVDIADGQHLSIVSLDSAGLVIGYNDYTYSQASTPPNFENSAAADPATVITTTEPIIPVIMQGTSIIFKVDNTSDSVFDDLNGVTYNLEFEQKLRYADGTLSSTDTAIVKAQKVGRTHVIVPVASGNIAYDSQYITNLSPSQLNKSATQNTEDIKLDGNDLNANVKVQAFFEDGAKVALGSGTLTNGTISPGTVISHLSPTLAPGNYMLRVMYGISSSYTLAQFPFVLANPNLTKISPASAGSENVAITASGTGFGRDETKLKLKFTYDTDPTVVISLQSVVSNSLLKGSEAKFMVPANLAQGTYTVTLLNDGIPAGSTSYVVNSSASLLKENLELSRSGRYKVFDFKADLSLSNSKLQSVKFQFYNVATDRVLLQPRTFLFNYIDSSLPYVDHISKGELLSDFPLSLNSVNEINELPETFNIYADTNTNKVNLYLGDSINAPIYKTIHKSTAGAYKELNTQWTASGPTQEGLAAEAIPGEFKLNIGGAEDSWLPGDKIVIDNITFVATNLTANANSFDVGDGSAGEIAQNLAAALLGNPAISTKYSTTYSGTSVTFQQNGGYESPIQLTVTESSARGTASVSIETPYESVTLGAFKTTVMGSAGDADSITVTVDKGGLTLPITSDPIAVKGKNADQVASSIAARLNQIGIGSYTVSNPSGTSDIIFKQTHAFSLSQESLEFTINGGYHVFVVNISGLPNGPTQITAVPSTVDDATKPAKLGENLVGQRTYDLNILSTPYVILDNLYNGLILKDDPSTIAVEDQTNLLTCNENSKDSCFSGRLVNVPETEFSNVEVSINGVKSNLRNPLDFDPLPPLGKFTFQFGPNSTASERQQALTEGKNTIKFSIYSSGKLVAVNSFDVFILLSSGPSFVTLKPDETIINANLVKYVATAKVDNYATSETQVAFIGQIANATDIKLTVKTVDETGQIVANYDRRYDLYNGSTFGTLDPVDNNPLYLDIDGSTGIFTTRSIELAKKGNTTFEFAITNSTQQTVVRTVTIIREPQTYRIIKPQLTLTPAKKLQANINSNYIEIEMEAEGADKVTFGKDEAVARQVPDINNSNSLVTRYFYEAKGLKAGANNISFTVVKGDVTTKQSFILFNADTPIEGAQFKTLLKNKLNAFNSEVQLSFPANTNLLRNDTTLVNQFISTNRSILFGIASSKDGRVDKILHPSGDDAQIGNPNPEIDTNLAAYLDTPLHFRAASKLYWLDAGTISSNETDMNKALNGTGQDPYDTENFNSRAISDLVVPSKRGTLTLKYDPNIRNDSWKYLTVYHYDIYEDYTGSIQYHWKNLGGVVDTSKHTITVPFDTFGYYQVMYMNQSFDDVTGHGWARNQIDTLFSKGIMLNKDETMFQPEDPISRGEFATLLVKIFDFPLQYSESPTFDDVYRKDPSTNGLYDYMSIETAAKVGIVRGGGQRLFSPSATITREDAATMIARAANLKLGTDTDKSLVTLQKAYTDANSISIYARTSIEAVTKAGLINGIANVLIEGQKKQSFRYDPGATLTRAEAAQVSIQVLKQQKKIPK
ncbi:S-layer homology domain-containing protein [Paenibacillus psychroresistens]|uniref:S-layer homology domain-containing protein n=1 Tax=Paenibacillus psychroresistens TaxID=1778678 RepID=A0A6B8RCA0_9BACL|nr:S-layer homology domain-containing protein [Paenibacillus psychroresistens]QGQ93504.1 S-layer homology domain-containing protein [Paenibacillus psychroresistens]